MYVHTTQCFLYLIHVNGNAKTVDFVDKRFAVCMAKAHYTGLQKAVTVRNGVESFTLIYKTLLVVLLVSVIYNKAIRQQRKTVSHADYKM